MSLQTLTAMRLGGNAPVAVWVLLGGQPKWMPDSPNLVSIRAGDDIAQIDFRPLIGLHVDVFEISGGDAFFERASKAIDAAKPKSTGLATRHGFSGVSQDHVEVLRKAWELLCI